MTKRVQAWHGWGFGPAVFDPLHSALVDRCKLSAPALKAPESGNFETWSGELAAQLSANEVLLGWSLGAMLALGAVAAGARPRALVLIGASPRFVASADWPHGLDAGTVAAFRSGVAEQPARTLKRFLALQTLGDSRRGAAQALLEQSLEADATKLTPALTALINADLRRSIGQIRVPTLLLHGENDALMPLPAATWLDDHLPDARLVVLPQCGHAPHVTQAHRIADALMQFLGSLPDA